LLPTIDEVVPAAGSVNLKFTDPVADADAAFTACKNYIPAVSSSNFAAMGRFDKDQSQYAQLYTNGWPIAGYTSTSYNHVAPPNWQANDCGISSAIADTPGEAAIICGRSKHPGVVNVCFGDGHVSSIGETIDLTTWRALGTRNGGEQVKADY
jgi:prepilin-type processing-associated H-X9-DG protein